MGAYKVVWLLCCGAGLVVLGLPSISKPARSQKLRTRGTSRSSKIRMQCFDACSRCIRRISGDTLVELIVCPVGCNGDLFPPLWAVW